MINGHGDDIYSKVYPEIDINNYLHETLRLKDLLEATGRIEVYPSDTHYMLCLP
jgi:hypothetical protein